MLLTHPDLSQSHVVLDENLVHSTREGVGLSFPKDGTNSGAGYDLQLPSTHPDLQKHRKTLYLYEN